MSNNLGIKKTHELMKDRLIDYVTSQYFGENQLLLNASDEILRKDANIYQKPFIESTPSYLKIDNGISTLNIDGSVKAFFMELANHNLGVFNSPFKHQVDSLEYFSQGKNLFVATGTGSGKTECFMWPILYKLINETLNSKKTWEQRGVRTILIYPMNALVSDQITRLRSIIGDENNEFVKLLNEFSGKVRRPQFGMYTGRTPYPGEKQSKKINQELAQSYEKSYLISDDLTEEEMLEKKKDINCLKKISKYPSKNMNLFVSSLKDDTLEKYDSSDDAELVLRYEMQEYTPDILITNYSMLEYMLIRKVENNIWDNTKKWLEAKEENKLLLVIDEAHMYSGASGGEVALLIRRLFSRLGIDKNKVQFIMTSASMPNETDEDLNYIYNFSENLSGCKRDSFKYLFGEKVEFKVENPIETSIEKLAQLELDSSILTDENIDKNIKCFAKEIYGQQIIGDSQQWLYHNILRCRPFVDLLNLCRKNAISYDDLQQSIVKDDTREGNKAFENILLLAPLAKDENNNVLFPARIHLFFRGLNGIYACSNPNCSHKHTGDDISLGALFTSNIQQCPYCHSKVYEIINDRRCGALYLKTYINQNDIFNRKINCWSQKGVDESHHMIEFPLYIIPKGYDFSSKPKNTDLAYLDTKSGILYSNCINEETCIKVLKSSEIDENDVVFNSCPKCGKKFRFIKLTDFRIKGNLPFYNIIKAQFDAQPMTKNPTKFVPNGGKKVLLFSDSRQAAAILARDMTKIADKESFRRTIYLAMEKLYGSSENKEIEMSCLYPAFVEVAVENKLRFFYGKQLDKFEEDKNKVSTYLSRNKKRNREINYSRLEGELNTPCSMYQADLIELFCSPTINFHNLCLGYIVPLDENLDDSLDDINDENLTKEEFIKIFIGFLCKTFTDSFSFDNTVPENIRKEVKYIKGNRYGFKRYDSYINKNVKIMFPNTWSKIYDVIVKNFYREEEDYFYLNLKLVKIHLVKPNDKWVRCKRCGQIHPFAVNNCCSICESPNIEFKSINDFKEIDYWRKPLFSDENVKSLNTEEHTAQLSYSDQKNETWAKTEDYEMRFQDINVEKEGRTPIDILSCTTTMEVGIDIGSLTAIGLRNVPPLRENYQQRAGRAGRRGTSLSTITTYAQGGPHDTFYFNHPEKIIRGKPRKPWIDVNNMKIISRHYNLLVLTKFFENRDESIYDCNIEKFYEIQGEFYSFVNKNVFTPKEIETLFKTCDIQNLKEKFLKDIKVLFINKDKHEKKLFDSLFENGILPTYSFPLDVVSFNIEGDRGETKLSPQRSIDLAISEYAPGRTIVVDKKTYQSAGIYSPIHHKNEKNFSQIAEHYFNEENGYLKELYMCENPICGWFGENIPSNGVCPFCGHEINENSKKLMLKPWGFAPLNGKEISESEANSELTYTDEPCYSATPSKDLKDTAYINLKICNRINEQIIILNKGIDSQGFDVCKSCGAAQLHNGKSLKENGIGAPYTIKGRGITCGHKSVEENLFLGTSFITDMFFMQINIDITKITKSSLILKMASVTLCEALKLSASRILEIEYNDLTIGNRTRSDGIKKYIDIFFYDSLSSGAGYSTQVESNLDLILNESLDILESGDSEDICNFWNQRVQKYFNKNIAKDLLLWIMNSKLPRSFTEEETKIICVPLVNVMENEMKMKCEIYDNSISVNGEKYIVVPAFISSGEHNITDFEIMESLPDLVEKLISSD